MSPAKPKSQSDSSKISLLLAKYKKFEKTLEQLKTETREACEAIWAELVATEIQHHREYAAGNRVIAVKTEVGEYDLHYVRAYVGLVVGHAVDRVFRESLKPLAVLLSPMKTQEKAVRIEAGTSSETKNDDVEHVSMPLEEFDRIVGDRSILVPVDRRAAMENFDATKDLYRSRRVEIYGLLFRKKFYRLVEQVEDEFTS